MTFLVLDSASSPITKRVYNMALDDFFGWYGREPRPGFTKATVSAWRVTLEERGLGSSSIIVRMSAIRKLAVEARLGESERSGWQNVVRHGGPWQHEPSSLSGAGGRRRGFGRRSLPDSIRQFYIPSLPSLPIYHHLCLGDINKRKQNEPGAPFAGTLNTVWHGTGARDYKSLGKRFRLSGMKKGDGSPPSSQAVMCA